MFEFFQWSDCSIKSKYQLKTAFKTQFYLIYCNILKVVFDTIFKIIFTTFVNYTIFNVFLQYFMSFTIFHVFLQYFMCFFNI